MKTKITQNIKAIILGLVVTIGVGYVSADTFTSPLGPPPGNNVPAPINVGGGVGQIYSQFKTGALTLWHLFTPDLTVTRPDGTVNGTGNGIKTGELLMADSDNTGHVKWGNIEDIPNIKNTICNIISCNTITNNPPGNGGNDLNIYTFNSSYYTLMQNDAFRAWFITFTNGSALIKPKDSQKRNDEGWTEWNPQVTANKLCNFFTGGNSVSYKVVSLGSGNNNFFTRWDNMTNAWQMNYSSWQDSRDISSISCFSPTGKILNGSELQFKPTEQGGKQCTPQTYRNQC